MGEGRELVEFFEKNPHLVEDYDKNIPNFRAARDSGDLNKAIKILRNHLLDQIAKPRIHANMEFLHTLWDKLDRIENEIRTAHGQD